MSLSEEIYWKIAYLRAMLSVMSAEDVDLFTQVCDRLTVGSATIEDLQSLDKLFDSFKEKQ